jgi:hypothetical protein
MYKIVDGDNFGSILKQFVKDESIINAKTPLVKKIIAKNPQVLNWAQLTPGILIEVYVSEDFIDMTKYKKYESANIEKINEEEAIKQSPSYTTGLKGSVFYMASLGIFTQTNNDVGKIKFNQNAPFSTGASFTYYPKNKLYSYTFGGYTSYLMASLNNLNTNKISIPPEIGLNFFGEYRFVNYNTTVYLGPDFERFSTFNMEGLSTDQNIYVDQTSAIYLTAGIAKALSIKNRQFFFKSSLSKSIFTTYSNGSPYNISTEQKYSGYKFLFYLNYKFSDKVYLHTLLKYHTMSGPSDLTTLRIGVGIGYILF